MARYRIDLSFAYDADMGDAAVRGALLDALGASAGAPIDPASVRIQKRALDARRGRHEPTWRLTVEFASQADITHDALRRAPPQLARCPRLRAPAHGPVIVVGAGPAGLFAAWRLAECGLPVALLERGKPVERRARDFGRFRGRGELNPESNLCFGEGGAGTYSDGKLTTRKNDPYVAEVFARLVRVGAPKEILVDAKPHIGTNRLFRMLKSMRAVLIDHGVQFHFETRAERLRTQAGRVVGVDTGDGQMESRRTILALGHSARDTFRALRSQGVPMEPKAFSVGVRAEHPQAWLDERQYRMPAPRPAPLPAADYRLTHQENHRGVYSFCMCPGGMIVPTATEYETVAVNGMSTARRSSPFANSGIVVEVRVEDFLADHAKEGPLAGVAFQHALERRSFIAGGGGYHAPATRAPDFLRGRASTDLAPSHFRPGLCPSNLRELFPKFLVDGLVGGLRKFEKTLPGFAAQHANLIAVESRTSSPIRIPRDPQNMSVPGFAGLYVAGEGPGYAGGIVSAAADGLRVADAILSEIGAEPAHQIIE